jgi:hypothetical protein
MSGNLKIEAREYYEASPADAGKDVRNAGKSCKF